MRVTGLPLHLWCWELFKKLGDSCGGFFAMDKNTTFLCNKQWARVLMRSDRRKKPVLVWIVAGHCCFAVQLWWKVPLWLS